MKSRTTACTLSGLALVVAAACGDDGSVADESQDVCNSVENLQSTVADVAGTGVDPATTTVGDVHDALDNIQSGVQAVQDAGSRLGDAVQSALESAYDDFQSALQDVPSDDTLAEAGHAVESAQAEFARAWSDTISELDCTSPTSSS